MKEEIMGIFSSDSNVSKYRKTLMDYLQSEGVSCELRDGNVAFSYNDIIYEALFGTVCNQNECAIRYLCNDERYVALIPEDKALIAARVNADSVHVTMVPHDDNFVLFTSFYFVTNYMLKTLFAHHFQELTEAVDLAVQDLFATVDRISEMVNSQECEPGQQSSEGHKIGFKV